MHGAWHHKSAKYGSDWYATVTKGEKGGLVLEHADSKKDYGTLTKDGIKWKKESWTRVHTVAPQFAQFRRPPYPMLSLYIMFTLKECAVSAWRAVGARISGGRTK